jgi:hypothetical protein
MLNSKLNSRKEEYFLDFLNHSFKARMEINQVFNSTCQAELLAKFHNVNFPGVYQDDFKESHSMNVLVEREIQQVSHD